MKIRSKILIILICIFMSLLINIPKVEAVGEVISYDGITTTMPEILTDTVLEDPETTNLNINDHISSIITPVGAVYGMQVNCSDLMDKYESETTVVGIDVSKWQGDIDWKKVKDSGIKYVMIRCGYRGYGSNGTLVVDDYFKKNIEGAIKNDIDVGVYFFSAAINKAEAIQEAQLVLNACDGYDITLPIVYDFEYFGDNFDPQSGNPYRTNGLTNKRINENAQAFLGYIRQNSNYKTMLYGSSYYLKTVWNVDSYLKENDIWLAHYPSQITSDKSTYTGEYQMWQCTDAGIVPGINGFVDMNFDYTYYPFKDNKIIFLDVASDAWYYNPVKYCKDNEIILGYGDTREYFRPDEKITRGMFVTILYRMAGKPEINNKLAKNFPDVKKGEYYESAVKWASSIGIVNGFEDGTFGPNKPILRQDLVIMFRKYVNKILEKDVIVQNEDYILEFADYNKINGYALDAVKWAVENKVITGKTSANKVYVDPLGSATRAETASIIHKYIKNSRIDTYDNGFKIKGKLNISKIGLECNILENATASSLEVAPGIMHISQCSSILKQVEDLNVCGANAVITGHNYRTEEAFSNLDELENGDKILITDQDGKIVEYTIYKTYYVDASDVSYIERDLDINSREITLTTISDDGSKRLIVLAKDK